MLILNENCSKIRILRLQEGYIFEHWLHVAKDDKKPVENEYTHEDCNFENFEGIFLIYLIGASLSVIVILLERIIVFVNLKVCQLLRFI